MQVFSKNAFLNDHKLPGEYSVDEVISAVELRDELVARKGTPSAMPEDSDTIRFLNQIIDYNRPLALRLLKMMNGD